MRSLAAAALLAALVLVLVTSTTARAVSSPATTIDGPSADVLGLGGVAMSEDGSGGVVYRRRVDGRAHIFVAQFADGRWLSPQRADIGQRFDSSWPAIGAGDGGRLVVTWVQENGPGSDRMFSASLDPGARRFSQPVPVDLNIGESTDTWPALAMSRGGQAFLVFRVCEDPAADPNLPPGTKRCELRGSRYTGQLWSSLGALLNRNPASPVSTPDALNAPKVAIDASGQGIVAFQERDDEFIDRIYARRLFGTTVTVPLLVSPQKLGDAPLRAPADQFSLADAGFGQGTVAFRQRPAPGAPQRGTRIYAATIPETFVQDARAFAPARVVDGQGDGGPPVAPGPVAVAGAPAGAFSVSFSVGGQSLLVGSDGRGVGAPERLDAGGSSVQGDPVLDLSPTGALAVALRTRTGDRGQVQLLERRADGVPGARSVSTARGGLVGELRLAGSGLGDAAIAWQQGSGAFTQIGVATIDAPPEDFGVQTPADFVRGRGALRLGWDVARNAIGPVTYTVVVDDGEVASGLTGERYDLPLRRLPDGVHQVHVVARDGAGQETDSSTAQLKIDRTAPRVAVRVTAGRRVRVVVSDGPARTSAGVNTSATRVGWGDGRRGAAVRHVFARAGVFRIRVSVRDTVGNARTVTRSVRVR